MADKSKGPEGHSIGAGVFTGSNPKCRVHI